MITSTAASDVSDALSGVHGVCIADHATSTTTGSTTSAAGTPRDRAYSASDLIAPQAVGEYVAAELPDSRYVLLDATGHCPNLSAPDETVAAIRDFLAAEAPTVRP